MGMRVGEEVMPGRELGACVSATSGTESTAVGAKPTSGLNEDSDETFPSGVCLADGSGIAVTVGDDVGEACSASPVLAADVSEELTAGSSL